MSEAIETALRFQIGGCRHLGSELYARLLERARDDYERGGPVRALLDGWEGDPVKGFLPLRLLGAVHARVVSGEAPELARHYPTVGGTPVWPGAGEAFLGVVEEQGDALRPQLERFPQTNETRRCAGLLPGFLEIARRHPECALRLREIGASAGLNLFWDRYAYTLGEHRWGDPSSPVQLEAEWKGGAAAFECEPAVESRAACDIAPVRIESPDEIHRLESYVWADQPERLERVRAAVAIARSEPFRLDEASASEWLPAELENPPTNVTRVVFHSSVWLYIPDDERVQVIGTLESLGADATSERPLAWLRHEDDFEHPGKMELRLRLWPGGEDEVLADGHPHGRFVHWKR